MAGSETDQLNELIAARVSDLGLDLEAVEVTGGGRRRVLAVAVDRDGGVGIDDIAAATRAISTLLDADDALTTRLLGPGAYTLEVASRGTDRPLTEPRHWRRNRDRLVRARLTEGDVVEGRIGDSDDTGADLVTKAATRRIAFDDIESALIRVELNRPTERKDA